MNNNSNSNNNFDSHSTYIGEKGYTIFKDCLTIDDQHFIRENLTVKPYIPNSIVKAQEFPIYRESQKKFYIPKYFGIEHFGDPETLKITDGDDIDINFKGSLRDYQKPIIEAFLNKTKNKWGGGGLLDIPCGYGKCLAKDTPIIMYDGSIKLVQNIKINDKIMGDDSTPRNILSLASGSEELYKITPKYGDSYIVNKSHILSLKCVKTIDNMFVKDKIYDISIEKILILSKTYNIHNILHGYRVPIEFKKKEVSINPYFIGYWIGYTNYLPKIYNYTDEELINLIADIIQSNNITFGLLYYFHQFYLVLLLHLIKN